MTEKNDLLTGREVTTGVEEPEADPVTYMTDADWWDTWGHPEGRRELLPQTPPHILKQMFGVDSYQKLFEEEEGDSED